MKKSKDKGKEYLGTMKRVQLKGIGGHYGLRKFLSGFQGWCHFIWGWSFIHLKSPSFEDAKWKYNLMFLSRSYYQSSSFYVLKMAIIGFVHLCWMMNFFSNVPNKNVLKNIWPGSFGSRHFKFGKQKLSKPLRNMSWWI